MTNNLKAKLQKKTFAAGPCFDASFQLRWIDFELEKNNQKRKKKSEVDDFPKRPVWWDTFPGLWPLGASLHTIQTTLLSLWGGWSWCKSRLETLVFTDISSNKGSKTIVYHTTPKSIPFDQLSKLHVVVFWAAKKCSVLHMCYVSFQ